MDYHTYQDLTPEGKTSEVRMGTGMSGLQAELGSELIDDVASIMSVADVVMFDIVNTLFLHTTVGC